MFSVAVRFELLLVEVVVIDNYMNSSFLALEILFVVKFYNWFYSVVEALLIKSLEFLLYDYYVFG